MNTRDSFVNFITGHQEAICKALEEEDGSATFISDKWEREGGGGGDSRILSDGKVFEKAGVNISMVHGEVTTALAQQLKTSGSQFFAAGISLVIHPLNPMVPTTHANFRYFELYDGHGAKSDAWFGGGADLTPYYLIDDDVVHFHAAFKKACDATDTSYYPKFKKHCDEYFNNTHRGNERRGVGGIFYDYLRPDETRPEEMILHFSKACAHAFLDAYLPIVAKNKTRSYTEENIHWQQIRRGRYVEFNLLHDRGTLFGLKSNGRTESILMSLPPRVRFDYNDQPKEGSEEARLVEILKNPLNWC